MDWSVLVWMGVAGRSWLAQASPSPTPAAPSVDAATIEFLKGQFSSLTTSFQIYVGLLSAVTVLFIGVAAWLFNKTLKEARQEVDQLVKAEVRREIAKSIKSRVDLLERVLEQEEVPGLVTVDYLLQAATGKLPPDEQLPKEYRLLKGRFPRLQARKLESRKFNGDVVVLDLVNYQPTGGKLEESELEQVLQAVVDKMAPESVLAVYVRGRFTAIENLSQKLRYYTSTNVPVQLVGNVINGAYVAHALRGEDE